VNTRNFAYKDANFRHVVGHAANKDASLFPVDIYTYESKMYLYKIIVYPPGKLLGGHRAICQVNGRTVAPQQQHQEIDKFFDLGVV